MDGYQVIYYFTASGKYPYKQWLLGLRDTLAKVAILRRLNRLVQGNLGDYKPCREGVWELRFSNGYRLYYSQVRPTTLMILWGGIKDTQRTDIDKAVLYWKDWQERSNHEPEA